MGKIKNLVNQSHVKKPSDKGKIRKRKGLQILKKNAKAKSNSSEHTLAGPNSKLSSLKASLCDENPVKETALQIKENVSKSLVTASIEKKGMS